MGGKGSGGQSAEPVDTTTSREAYLSFYEEVGRFYPETELVHHDRSEGSKFDTILRELKPFARRRASLLDVGCNDGIITAPYCEMGGIGRGIDISESLIQRARTSRTVPNISFEVVDIEERSMDPEAFDVALMSSVVEHLSRPRRALRNVRESLTEGGHLLLTAPTPLLEILHGVSLAYLKRAVLSSKLLERQVLDTGETRHSRYGIGRYLYRHDGYYPRGLKEQVEGCGFHCVKLYTFRYEARPFSAFGGSTVMEKTLRQVPVLKLCGTHNLQLYLKI
jgi:2-polyprenyl-3-methyl-5-hydroxy-6-metoxy-1,4-benzoquinol methylase